MSDERRDTEDRRLPPWLMGLIIAALLFVVLLLVFQALGYGDNPVLEQSLAL